MPGVDFHLATLRKVKVYLPEWALKEIHSRAFAKSGGKARWRQGEAERYGPEGISKEYLEATYDVVSEHKDLIPAWLFNKLHEMAFPSSGGIAKARKYKAGKKEPLAKTSLAEMTPDKLKKLPDAELGQAWFRVNEWYVGAKKNGKAVETFINAGSFVYDEMKARKYHVNDKLDLVKAIRKLRLQALKQDYSKDESDTAGKGSTASFKSEKETVKKQSDSLSIDLNALFDNAPDDVLLVPDFVDFVGSSVTGHQPNDLDILFRADEKNQNFLLQSENIQLRIQQVLDPEKKGLLHYVNNPQGSHADYVPLYDLRLVKVNKFGKTLVKSDEIRPGAHFSPEKPSMAGVTEYFNTSELWSEWAKDKLIKGAKLIGEVKYDGFRCIVTKQGQSVTVWYEDAEADRSKAIPDFIAAVKKAPFDSFILDGEMLAKWNDKLVPRTQTLGLLSDKPFEFEPYLYIFDCLYLNGEDLHGKSLEERHQLAANVVKRLDPTFFTHSTPKVITDEKSLQIIGKWAAAQEGSEGLMVKDATKPYQFAASEDWAKYKTIVEEKCCVLSRDRKQNGYSYRCGLRDDGTYTNKTKLGNQSYIDLGNTFVLPQNIANVGDTINVQIEELIIQRADDGSLSLAMGKPTVRGPDKSRPAYTASQAVQVARAGHILKEEVKKIDLYPNRPLLKEDMPLIAFVGGSPDPLEIAREESMVSVHGRMFKEEYLDPLGLEKNEVALLNIVPLVLRDPEGHVRGPNQSEAAKWLPWVNEELENLNPDFTIALGHAAANTLSTAIDMVLPHPKALTHSSRPELNRKIKQFQRMLIKQASMEEQETRGQAAEQFWHDNWFKEFPVSGSGKFVIHEHWRGLTKDELTASRDELIKSGHSVHSDLRLQSDAKELHGWTIFLGPADKNQTNRFIDLPPTDNLQVTPKQLEPISWLTYHGASEPGAVGATSQKFARFDIVDHGTYRIGVWREHYFEYFLSGEKVKGRVQVQYAPMGGTGQNRVWLIGRPQDQKPYSDSHKLADVIKELKDKDQQYLVWCDGKSKPDALDLTKPIEIKGLPWYDKIITKTKKDAKLTALYKTNTPYNFDHTFELLSADDNENRLVTGVVYKPNELDTQREWGPPDELEKAARWWMEHSQATGVRHVRRAEARVTQSYIAPQDITIGNRLVKAGSWIVELRILAKRLWQEIKTGVYNAFSMGGYVTRTPGILPPGLSKAKAGDRSTINKLSDIQPLEITLCASGANKEKRFPLLKCDMCPALGYS
jgi:hypothetical protein